MKKKLGLLVAILVAVSTLSLTAYAANNSTYNQVITTGTLATDILDASQAPVASPAITMSSKAFSFSCYSSGTASTGTFGTNTERIYVINPDGADAGWNLTVAATAGATALWANGGATQTYDYNDAGGSGCTDAADTDTRPGQMTIDATPGTITLDCASTCASTSVTKGSSATFLEGTVSSATLMAAAAGSDDVWRGYLTGASVSQTIPAQQAATSYTLNMTLTVTAL